jgi:hypothetical protein
MVCIGGLLVCNSSLVWFVWNAVAKSNNQGIGPITLLEGAGITAFFYVIVFSIRYGMRAPRKHTATTSAKYMPGESACIDKLTQEQKLALKAELINSCGCKEQGNREATTSF